MKTVFVTSSSMQDQLMSASFPILQTQEKVTPHELNYLNQCKVITWPLSVPQQYNKFINRFFPVNDTAVPQYALDMTEEEYQAVKLYWWDGVLQQSSNMLNLIKFRKHNRQSVKQRRKRTQIVSAAAVA